MIFRVTLDGRVLYTGGDRYLAHRLAREHAQAAKYMGECVMLLGDGQLTTYRRGPDGVERKDY